MVDLDIRLSVAGDLAVDVEAEGAAADFDMVLGYNMGGGGGADLQAKSVTYTPTTAEQTDTVHADSGYDGLSRVNVTVGAMPAGMAGTPTAAKGAVSGHSVAVTPSVTNSAGYIAGGTETGAPVTVSAAELVDGTLSITANGPYDVTNYAGATVSVSAPTPALQSKTATPTEQQQTVTADSGYDGLSSVTVDAIDAGYVGSGVTRRTSSSLTASGATVTAPAGYYASAASKSVASGSATPAASISATGASVSTGTNTLTLSKTVGSTPQVSAGYVGSGTAGNSSVSLTASVTTKAAATITPSTSAQTIAAGTYLTGTQTIAAMPTGTAGTPTAAKGSVSNHSVSVTPSVTNTTGYITGGTKTGTAVSVSASELVSGTLLITSSGTADVTNYASASVSAGAATASATKGTVSNHSIAVTPSVSRSAGWISAGTASGTAVTVSASELVSGSETKTANGTYDVTNLAELVVNVSGGGGTDRLTLLSTADMGTIATSSTSAANTGVTLTAEGIDDYDLLIVEAACTKTNDRHLATYSLVYLYNTSNLSSRTAAVVANAKLNYKVTSAGVVTSRGATANYGGVYVQSCSISASGSTHNATMTMYKKYTSNDTNTLNGTYTGKIYGIKLHELLGL